MTSLPPILLHEMGIRYDLKRSRKKVARKAATQYERLDERGRFWALRGVNLRVESGESLAVIGPNGAGKSTLLKVLAGIIAPDEGTAEVRGSIATLLKLEAGFDDELNAEENILLVGEYLGIPAPEMRLRIPEILEFADIGEFSNAPARTYSAGMRARLGFSVATSIEPDVLLLDEVLSTGDEAFKEKSRMRMVELMQKARAIVYVTHDLDAAEEFCSRAIQIENGRVVADGKASDVIDAYRRRNLK